MNSIWLLVTFAMMAMASPQSPSAEFPLQVRVFQTNPGHFLLLPQVAPDGPPRLDWQGRPISDDGIIPWNALVGAEVWAGDQKLAYDAARGIYTCDIPLQAWTELQVVHPGFHTRKLRINPLQGLATPLDVYLTREGELTGYHQRQGTPAPDPRRYQRDGDQFGWHLPLNTVPYPVRGCIIGQFALPAEKEFLAFAQQHQLKLTYIDISNAYFSLAPSSGQTEAWLYGTVLPELRQQAWVREAGPFWNGNENGFVFVPPTIYLEFYMDTPAPDRDAVLAHPQIKSVQRLTDRVGVMVEVDPALGLDVLALAESWMQTPGVRYADVQTCYVRTQPWAEEVGEAGMR